MFQHRNRSMVQPLSVVLNLPLSLMPLCEPLQSLSSKASSPASRLCRALVRMSNNLWQCKTLSCNNHSRCAPPPQLQQL